MIRLITLKSPDFSDLPDRNNIPHHIHTERYDKVITRAVESARVQVEDDPSLTFVIAVDDGASLAAIVRWNLHTITSGEDDGVEVIRLPPPCVA